jgi:hypothetical protein
MSLRCTRKERLKPMPKIKKVGEVKRPYSPASTPEARENQLISLAIDLAEKQLLEGTASSQVITHYLKLGSTKERLEKQMMEKQVELITAKTEALQAEKKAEELYSNAIEAMRKYNGYEEWTEEPTVN